MHVCDARQGSIAWWILIACWALFAGVWLIGSLYNRRHSGTIEKRGKFGWFPVLAAVAALALLPQGIWRPLTICAPWLTIVGVVLLVGSTAFTIWARIVLGRMWSSMPVKRAGHELRTDGPYRVTRHPIYTGIIGMTLGTALINGIGTWGAALILFIAGLIYKLRVEERLMRDAFGDAYTAYKARVPGLLPWPRPGKDDDMRRSVS
jgi:protein-S-isoprenylcysteine O-methyltransferase Ste14